jgi:hypothetical protein
MFTFAQRMCVFTFAAIGLFAQAIPAQETYTFGMIGVAEGQTGRLNVLNPGVAPPATGLVCSALLTFLDAKGNTIKSEVVSVPPQQSMSYDLFSDRDLALVTNERVEIRATITIPPILPPVSSTAPASAPCKLIKTLEVFDSLTGRTQALLDRAHLVPNPVVVKPVTTP